jgi:hypothetical protein
LSTEYVEDRIPHYRTMIDSRPWICCIRSCCSWGAPLCCCSYSSCTCRRRPGSISLEYLRQFDNSILAVDDLLYLCFVLAEIKVDKRRKQRPARKQLQTHKSTVEDTERKCGRSTWSPGLSMKRSRSVVGLEIV